MNIPAILSHGAIAFAVSCVSLAVLHDGIVAGFIAGIYLTREALNDHNLPHVYAARLFSRGLDAMAQGLVPLIVAALLTLLWRVSL